jgi:hypothetical protein
MTFDMEAQKVTCRSNADEDAKHHVMLAQEPADATIRGCDTISEERKAPRRQQKGEIREERQRIIYILYVL